MDAPLLRDARNALRSLARAPGYTSIAVLTLALGIGVTTAGFSLFNALLLRPLPGIMEARNLTVVQFDDTVLGGSQRSVPVSLEQIRDLSEGTSAVAGLASFANGSMNVGTADTALQVRGEYVMPEYFSLLGTRPLLGRLLLDSDDAPGAAPVCVIGHDLWSSLLGRDSAVVGRRIRINTETFTVVGVTPAGFGGVSGARAAQLWVPAETFVSTVRAFGVVANWTPTLRRYQFVMRPAPGATIEQAEQELAARGLHVLGKRLRSIRGAGILWYWRGQTEETLGLVLTATAIVLLLACVNVAGLILLRGVHQWGESAMRKVLGAAIRNLAWRQALESSLLATGGAILGLGVAAIAVRAFRGAVIVRGVPPLDTIAFDWRVALFAVSAATVAATVAGMASLPLLARVTPIDAVRRSGRATTRTGWRLGRVFTLLQFAISLPLVVGAMLLFRTLRVIAGVELGFDPHGVALFRVDPAYRGHVGTRLEAYYVDLLERLRADPRVESVALASFVPFTGNSGFQEVRHQAAEGGVSASWAVLNVVSPDYFRALRIPVIRGRSFTHAESVVRSKERPPLVVINQSLATGLFGGADPIGKMVTSPSDPRPFEVVGVIADSRWSTLGEPRQDWERGPQIYQLYHATTSPGGELVVRARSGSEAQLLAAMQGIAADVDRSVPVTNPHMLHENIAQHLGPRRLLLKVLSWLSGLGVAVALVGLYGMVSYGVASRTREIGIRIALGAAPRRVRVGVLVGAGALAGLGIALGLVPSVLFGRVLGSMLVGVSSVDAASLFAASALLVGAALAAAAFPAQRAASMQPVAALRSE